MSVTRKHTNKNKLTDKKKTSVCPGFQFFFFFTLRAFFVSFAHVPFGNLCFFPHGLTGQTSAELTERKHAPPDTGIHWFQLWHLMVKRVIPETNAWEYMTVYLYLQYLHMASASRLCWDLCFYLGAWSIITGKWKCADCSAGSVMSCDCCVCLLPTEWSGALLSCEPGLQLRSFEVVLVSILGIFDISYAEIYLDSVYPLYMTEKVQKAESCT